MDIEQLKLILQTIEKAGDGAFFVAILHFGYPYAQVLLGWLGALAMILIIRSCILRGIEMANAVPRGDDLAIPIRELADTLGTKTPGGFTEHEKMATVAKLRQLVNEHLAQKKKD